MSTAPLSRCRGSGRASPRATAFREGRLEAYALQETIHAGGGGKEAAEAKKDEPPLSPKDEKTWIAIQLVSKSGQPAAYKGYRIELPDGSTREGMLDGKGMARIDGIDEGTCKVSFPALDARDWQPA